jgi:small multidrug resistance pump
MGYVYLAIAILAEVFGTTCMTLSRGFTRPVPAVLMVLGYAIAFTLLTFALKTIPTGVAYAIWSGVGIVLIATIAWLFLGQKLDAAAVVGMALIVAGVVILNRYSKVGGH